MSTLQFRAIVNDGDTTRERPLQCFGSSLAEMEEWAAKIMPNVLPGGGVNIFQTIEVAVKMIPKVQNETPKAD